MQCTIAAYVSLYTQPSRSDGNPPRVTDYSKKAFEDGTRAFEQLLGAKSFEQVIEIQSQYAKRAYEAYIAELSKLGEMYAGLTRNAYKPVEQAAAKAGSPNRRSA